MHDRAAAGAAMKEASREARVASQATLFASAAAAAAAAMGSDMGVIRRHLTDPLAANLGIVGVAPGTRNVGAIRSAYHRTALQVHPDKGGTAVAFRRLQDAYDRLKTKIEGLH